MDLSTTYLGMTLRTPLVASASPLSEEIDTIRRMEDAGISAVVLYSLFEEQLARDRFELHHRLTQGTYSYAEALSYFPEPSEFRLGPEEYLDHIRRAKEAVAVPIVASLNGSSDGGWVEYAREIERAGADAVELNVYFIPTDPDLPGEEIEQRYLDVVRAVKAEVRLPVAVKIGPYFSNVANMAVRLEEAGADGLVLFNRFYQPDVDLETLEIVPNLLLSTPQAMRLPLRWIAILRDRLVLSLAATSGIHWADDVLKMLLVGADVTMLCSTLLSHGVETIRTIERDMTAWLERLEYESVRQMCGSMSQRNCPEPSEFERVQYIRAINTRWPGLAGR
jgi:dihydroorotate dehydrogenase (fumarate)